MATPARSETTFDDFTMTKATLRSKGGDATTLDDILTPDVVADAVSRTHSERSDNTDEDSSFVEP